MRLVIVSFLLVGWIAPPRVVWAHGSRHKKKPVPTKREATNPGKPGVDPRPTSAAKTGEGPRDVDPPKAGGDGKPAKAHDSAERANPVAAPEPGHHEPTKGFSLLPFLGKLHPLAVHLPIGWLLLLLLVDLGTFGLRKKSWSAAGLPLLGLAVASLVPGVITGLLRHTTHGPHDAEALVLQHRNLMLAVAAVTATALLMRFLRRRNLERGWLAAYLVLMASAGVLLALGAHYGGLAVYGEGYFAF